MVAFQDIGLSGSTSLVAVAPGIAGALINTYGQIQRGQMGLLTILLLGVFMVAVVAAIVYMERAQRRIPVQYAKRVVGRRQVGGQQTYLPLKVNTGGVIPFIFASSILFLPVLLSNVANWGWLQTVVNDYLTQPDSIVYIIFFGLLIVGFAYFYTAISFDPVKQADNIRKQGGFVPGIRPGRPTERYLAQLLSRITLPGSLFLALIALTPAVVIGNIVPTSTQGSFSFTGISILIAVGVALETMKQIDSQLMLRNYEGFLK